MGADDKLQTDVCYPAWLATAGRNFLEAPAPHHQKHNALVTIERLAGRQRQEWFRVVSRHLQRDWRPVGQISQYMPGCAR